MGQRTRFVFLILFCIPRLWAGEFYPAEVKEVQKLTYDRFFDVLFHIPQGLSGADFLGCYLQVEKNSVLGVLEQAVKLSEPHIYAISHYPTEIEPYVGITVEVSEQILGHRRLSARLAQSRTGSRDFKVKLLRTPLCQLLQLSDDLVFISGGNAICRAVGVVRYFNEMDAQRGIAVIHSVREGKFILNKGLFSRYPEYHLFKTSNGVRLQHGSEEHHSKLSMLIRDKRKARFIVSGPSSFEGDIKAALLALEIPEENIIGSTFDTPIN